MELSHEGHRQRLREEFLNTDIAVMPEHHLLELILCYAIPRRDVKPIAYELINRFGSFQNVIHAPISELETVDGIGTSAALLINLFHAVPAKIDAEKCRRIKALTNYEESKEYAKNLLAHLDKEKVLVITLNTGLEIIGCHTVADGTRGAATVEPNKVVACAVKDDATSVIMAHNHPGGSYIPSEADIKITKRIRKLLRSLDISLSDHIIVGSYGTLSMNNDFRYSFIFDD